MSGKVYVIGPDGHLDVLSQTSYSNELEFQDLLAEHPDLLAGDQIDPNSPRRWLLVRREVSIPDAADTGGRWALDHLFLDQDGVPTLVEVKRSEDTRIRREVIGQILEYGANATVYWPTDHIRLLLEDEWSSRGEDADSELAEFLGEADPETYWRAVKTNLQAGRIRLVLVADRIPNETRRILEFLNEQMDPAEVLGVELATFAGGDLRTLVPRVVARTAEALDRKASSPRAKRKWDETSFLAELEEQKGPEYVEVARRVIAWCDENGFIRDWGSGLMLGSFVPVQRVDDRSYWFFHMWTSGVIEVQFQHLKVRPPFDDPAVREEFRARLNEIEGVEIPADSLERRPSFDMGVLRRPAGMERFVAVLGWAARRATSEQ